MCIRDRQYPSVLSAPTLMGHFYTLNALLQPPHTTRRYYVVLEGTPNQPSSGQPRACRTGAFKNESMALLQCPSVLSAPTSMGYFYTLNAILRMPLTRRGVDVVLPATPNQHSSGQSRACSTSTIDNESMALMQCPSVLSVPTLMGHFYASNAVLQPPHTTRR